MKILVSRRILAKSSLLVAGSLVAVGAYRAAAGPLLLLILLLPAAEQAQFTCVTNGGKLTITSYTGSNRTMTIPGELNGLPVTAIGDRAFFNCTNLLVVQIPNGVTSIGSSAFQSCTRLWSVLIPETVRSIGNSAFCSCTALEGVTFGGATSIGNQAFSDCTRLTSVTMPNHLTSIGAQAFDGCARLTNATLGHSVTEIGSQAFPSCTHLTVDGLADPVVARFCERLNGYKVAFTGPENIILENTSTIPLKIKITAPDGKPYNGQVCLRTDVDGRDGFLQPTGEIGPVTVDVVQGEVEAEFRIRSYHRDQFRVMVLKPPFPPVEPIGETTISARYVDSWAFLPEKSALCVPADGKAHPTVLMQVKDHAGVPLAGIEARAWHYIAAEPTSEQKWISAITDSEGIATFEYPALPVHQYALTQFLVASNYTSQVMLYYKDTDKPRMIDLRKAVARVKGATFNWDRAARLITITGVDVHKSTVVFKEGEQFVRVGETIIALEAPVETKGDIVLVPEFAGWEDWVY